MKKLKFLVLIIPLWFTACSDKPNTEIVGPYDFEKLESFEAFLDYWKLTPYLNACSSITDAFQYPDTMKSLDYFLIPDEIIHSMSTCGLLETLHTHPKTLFPWYFPFTFRYTNLPRVTRFNDSLRANNVAVEMYKRSDCFPVLAAKHLAVLQGSLSWCVESYLEMLFGSDMGMSALNEREKILSMAMALEKTRRYDHDDNINEVLGSLHVLAVIMRSCNYDPFLRTVGTEWQEGLYGYLICSQYRNEIILFAKQFLNEQKHKIHETY